MFVDMFGILAIGVAYLLGSIPFGLLLARLAGQDIREVGSGNIGATNVLRTGHKGLAALTLLLDILKGWLAVLVAMELTGGIALYLAGLACFLGHMFPVWLRFQGGKGVAVFIGIVIMLSPMTGITFLLGWAITALLFRYSSLAALVGMVLALLMTIVLTEMPTLYMVLAMTLLTFYAHRDNIKRLREGTESRIGQTG